jgi:hypothetical protein
VIASCPSPPTGRSGWPLNLLPHSRRRDQKQPPLRFIAGADAVATAEQVASTLQQQTNAFRELSTSLAFDEVGSKGTP